MSDQLRPLIDGRRPEELADSRRSGITAPPLGDIPGVITAADPPHGTTNFQSFWLPTTTWSTTPPLSARAISRRTPRLRGRLYRSRRTIREKRTIVGGPSSVWSAVTKNIAPGEVWAGTPARFFRKVALPGDLRTSIGAAVTGERSGGRRSRLGVIRPVSATRGRDCTSHRSLQAPSLTGW
jgi:hypothetical protein